MQRTLVLIKPDAFRRKLVSKVIGRIEDKGIEMANVKYWYPVPRNRIEKHYDKDTQKPYFSEYCDFMCSGPVISIIYEGKNVIDIIRSLQGNWQIPGTIRGDYVTNNDENLIHASDSQATSDKEIKIWFGNV